VRAGGRGAGNPGWSGPMRLEDIWRHIAHVDGAIGRSAAEAQVVVELRARVAVDRPVRLLHGLRDELVSWRLGLCFAEDERGSPWEPLHVERGYAPEDSVVTVIAADAPMSISDHRSKDPRELASVLGWAAGATWSPNWWPLGGDSLFVICPEHAALFGEAGWSKQRVRQEIFDAVRRPAAELRWGETTPLVAGAPDDQPIHKWSRPQEIVLVVAGGEDGRYSAVFGPCLGMEAAVVSKEVEWTT